MDRRFSVTLYRRGEPVEGGQFEVLAPTLPHAVSKIEDERPGLLDSSDDFTIVELQPEASER